MLMAHEIRPFLLHESLAVRSHALRCLRSATDQGPVTCDDLWAVVDRYGPEMAANCFPAMRGFVQTRSSVARALNGLRSPLAGVPMVHLQDAIESMGIELLQELGQEVLGSEALEAEAEDRIRRRLELAASAEPPEAMFARLMELAQEADNDEGRFDKTQVDYLIEAIARSPGEAPARALGVLRDQSIEDWRELYCVRLVGAARHEPAIETLLTKLTIDADMLREYTVDALAQIGTEQVVQRLREFVPGKGWEVRFFAVSPLERIKLPSAEDAMADLFVAEQDTMIRTIMAQGLCVQCARPDRLEMVRQGIFGSGYERGVEKEAIVEALLGAAVMVGHDMPEAAQWMAEAEKSAAKSLELARQIALDADEDDDEDEADWDLLPADQVDYDDPRRANLGRLADDGITMPIRRDGPKVGRNDPCPCGSGKKYKKCCGRGA